MDLSMDQANQVLASITTREQLDQLISQLDVSSSGKVTVLWGGNVSVK